jgi:hypothetical protein
VRVAEVANLFSLTDENDKAIEEIVGQYLFPDHENEERTQALVEGLQGIYPTRRYKMSREIAYTYTLIRSHDMS